MQRRGDAGAARPVLDARRTGRASASSGSRAFSARVTLVSRVPNRKVCTRLRASVTAWRKCRKSRVYWLMEPEISSSATIGGALVRGPRYFRSMMAPPALRLARSVRRMSMRWPWRCGASRRVLTSSSAQPGRLIAALAAAISAAVICAKSFFCSTSRSDYGQAGVEFDLLRLRLKSFAAPGEQRVEHADRAGLRHLRLLGAHLSGDHHRHELVEIAALAEKDAERLVEDERMLVPLHEHRMQRPVKIVRRGRRPRLPSASASSTELGPNRDAGGAQRAREIEDVLGEPAGLLVSAIGRTPAGTLRRHGGI